MNVIKMKENLKMFVKQIYNIDNKSIKISRTKYGISVGLSYGLNEKYSVMIGDTYFMGYDISWNTQEEYLKSVKNLLKLKRFVKEQIK